MIKNPEIQFQTTNNIKAFQEAQLQQELTYLSAHSKFYGKMFSENNIDIKTIKTIEDLIQYNLHLTENAVKQIGL